MSEDNCFSRDEEYNLHDAFLMIQSDDTDYESLEDVILGETTYTEDSLERWRDGW